MLSKCNSFLRNLGMVHARGVIPASQQRKFLPDGLITPEIIFALSKKMLSI